MEVYLVRHTTPLIGKGICYGQTDLNLTPTYLDEFKGIKQKVPSSVDIVFSSPLIRCKQLAQYLYSEIQFDDRLKEIDFGKWEKKKWNHIDKTEIDQWMKDFVNISPPKGESFIELFTRVSEFWHELISMNQDNIVIISHAGVIRSVLAKTLDIPLKNAFKLKLSYGSVSKISINGKMESVDYLNH